MTLLFLHLMQQLVANDVNVVAILEFVDVVGMIDVSDGTRTYNCLLSWLILINLR